MMGGEAFPVPSPHFLTDALTHNARGTLVVNTQRSPDSLLTWLVVHLNYGRGNDFCMCVSVFQFKKKGGKM